MYHRKYKSTINRDEVQQLFVPQCVAANMCDARGDAMKTKARLINISLFISTQSSIKIKDIKSSSFLMFTNKLVAFHFLKRYLL